MLPLANCKFFLSFVCRPPLIQTNTFYTLPIRSCVDLGYWKDDFVQFFVSERRRRAPLINRGYWSRVSAVHKIINQFLSFESNNSSSNNNNDDDNNNNNSTTCKIRKQIVSLGAGFDTCFFQQMVM
jgi:tRNA wybutosine-synthesizing protein 4